MFGIEGPSASRRVPEAVFVRNHVPAARPPGTPPVPARYELVELGSMLDQLACASVPKSTTRSNALKSALPARAPLRRGRRPRARPARTATAGATGRRYWYPFVGQSEKKANGTRIHVSSNVSRHERSRQNSARPAIAVAT